MTPTRCDNKTKTMTLQRKVKGQFVSCACDKLSATTHQTRNLQTVLAHAVRDLNDLL